MQKNKIIDKFRILSFEINLISLYKYNKKEIFSSINISYLKKLIAKKDQKENEFWNNVLPKLSGTSNEKKDELLNWHASLKDDLSFKIDSRIVGFSDLKIVTTSKKLENKNEKN
jgi:hypothetical protein